MKKLILIRHSKTENLVTGQSDYFRPLKPRDHNDAHLIAEKLKEKGLTPDLLISSPAKRAEKTAKELVREINYDKKKIKSADSLYESSYEKYLELIHATDDKHESIFIIAHNPTITEVGERLSGAILSNIPTCAIVCISFDVESFKEITEESGHILFFDYPKKHLKN